MAEVRVRLDHALGRDEALRRVRARVGEAAARRTIGILDDETRWDATGGDVAVRALGQVFRGRVDVADEAVSVRLALPLLARPLAPTVGAIIAEEGRGLLQGAAPAFAPAHRIGAEPPRPRRRDGAGSRDAVIGVIGGYGWPDVAIWCNSLAETGFAGEAVLISLDPVPELEAALSQAGFRVVVPAAHERLATPETPVPILVERFALIAGLLERERWRNVVLTDVKDLVFQANPAAWLERALGPGADLVASSEGIRLGDEWWLSHLLVEDFGEAALARIAGREIRNAGVIAGTRAACRDAAAAIVARCTREGIKSADQAAYNLVLAEPDWEARARLARHDEPWACQAGTTADPRQAPLFRDALVDVRPVFEDGLVRAPAGEPYAIVHQYDRVPDWRAHFEARFG